MKTIKKFDDEMNLSIGRAILDYITTVNVSDMKFFRQGTIVKKHLDSAFKDYTTSSIHTFGHHIKYKNYFDFSDNVLFGFNFGGLLSDEYLIFVTEGIYYLKSSKENRTNKKGEIISTTVFFPEFVYYTDLEFKIVPKKKLFGLGSESEKEAVLKFIDGLNQIEYVFKKDLEDFFNNLIDTIGIAKSLYENKLTTGKSSLMENLKFNITESKGFSDYLDAQESVIAAIDPTVLQGLVKLANFLSMKEKQIKHETDLFVSDAYELRDLSIIQEHMDSQIKLYNEMYVLSLNMVVAFIEKKTIMYYKIYEVFDKVGVFNSAWQNGISGALSNIDAGIQDLIAQIDQLENVISSEIGMLRGDIIGKLDDFESTVLDSLGSIGTRINYGNLLSTVRMINGK